MSIVSALGRQEDYTTSGPVWTSVGDCLKTIKSNQTKQAKKLKVPLCSEVASTDTRDLNMKGRIMKVIEKFL